jgi:hypothetical protein
MYSKNIKNKIFKNKMRQEPTLKVNQLKWNWTLSKLSEIIIHMNNVKKPIKLYKKKIIR